MTDRTFRFTFRAPWSDADPAGLIYFSHFLKYFELAEFELYRGVGKEVSDFVKEFDIWLPRVEVHCNFFHPIYWDEVIEAHLQVIRLSDKSVTYRVRLYREGNPTLLTEGTMTVVCIDRKLFRAKPFPPPLFELLIDRLTPDTNGDPG